MGIVRITSDCIDCLTKGHLEKHPEGISEELKLVGEQIGVKVKMQHEDIFNCMHRI